MIKNIDSDITKLPMSVNYIMHVANVKNAMCSGVALGLKKRWPEVSIVDNEAHIKMKNSLGNVSVASVVDDYNNPFKIVNLYAQTLVRERPRNLNYEALYQALQKVQDMLSSSEGMHVAVPHFMGACRAGGNWNIIMSMLTEVIEPYCECLWIVKFDEKK